MLLAITQVILVGISSCVVAQPGRGSMAVANVTERSLFSPYGYPQQGYPPVGTNVGYPQQQGSYFPGQNQGQQYPQPGSQYYPQQQFPQQQFPQQQFPQQQFPQQQFPQQQFPQQQFPQQQFPQQQFPQQQYPQQQFPQQQFPQQQFPQQQFPQQQYPQQPYPQQPYPQQPYPQVPVPGLAPTTGTGFIRPPTLPGNVTAPTTAATTATTTTTTARPLQPGVVTAYPLGAGVGFGRPNNNAILPGQPVVYPG